jgi:alkanesulfonate monooxygenase SsuD/methylene tetrahydromethanopterin reductase-like flavin-dependent oxidoreductase (luciferase family)
MQRSVNDPTMRIGLFYPTAPNVHLASRVVNDLNPDLLDLRTHMRLAGACEEMGLDFLFLAESWGGHGPEARRVGFSDPQLLTPLLAVALIAATSRIGIVTTIHTSWFHPVVIARIGANLDALSHGRWGINIVTGAGEAGTLLAAVTEHSDHDERYAMAAEGLQVMKQLWRDGECDFDGRYYQVHGRIVGPAAVQQPHPAIFSAGASPAGRNFAAGNCDWFFIPGRMTRAEALERLSGVREELEAVGRPASSVRCMRHVSMLVRETEEQARRVSEWIKSTVDLAAARGYLKAVGGLSSTYADIYSRRSADEDSLREFGLTSGALKIHGSPAQVAERIKELYDGHECRGVALTFPLWNMEEIQRFGRLVLPLLEEMGLWTSPHKRGWTW